MGLSRNDGLWIQQEISKADFGDLRLNKRFSMLATELAGKPASPINQASSDWAATKAAYRFFNNPKVSAEKILEPHFLSTQLRTVSYKKIVVVQDTSIVDYTHHRKTTGLGGTGKASEDFSTQGFFLHTTLALTDKGLPLGLLDQRTWLRDHKKTKNGHERSFIPLEQKESFKWFHGLREALKKTEMNEVVMVCDREADIYELFEECLTNGVDFVIRAKQNRMLDDEDFGAINIFDRIGLESVKGQITIETPGSGRKKGRIAKLDIKFLPVSYAAYPRGIKTRQVKNRHHIELHVVHLNEANPPNGEPAIQWTLITSLPTNNLKSSLEVISFYRMRWTVELYFKCLKTGCNIESCRLNTGDKLIKFVSLQSVIAWRILWMTFLNRSEENLGCDQVLTENEWKTLWFKRHRRQIKSGEIKPIPPKDPPSTKQALRWIAMMGGFLGRKNDGEPGLITIWRGWVDLTSAVELYDVLN